MLLNVRTHANASVRGSSSYVLVLAIVLVLSVVLTRCAPNASINIGYATAGNDNEGCIAA